MDTIASHRLRVCGRLLGRLKKDGFDPATPEAIIRADRDNPFVNRYGYGPGVLKELMELCGHPLKAPYGKLTVGGSSGRNHTVLLVRTRDGTAGVLELEVREDGETELRFRHGARGFTLTL